MPTIDDFLRPEWIPGIVLDVGKVIRQWGEEKYIPVRRQIDEDWKEHKLVKPLMKEVLVDLGLSKAFWPAEVGGTDIPNAATFTVIAAEELARFRFRVCCCGSYRRWMADATDYIKTTS